MSDTDKLITQAIEQLEQEISERTNAVRSLRALVRPQAYNPHSNVIPFKKRTMSASARKRISLAQKKRWAKFYKGQKRAA